METGFREHFIGGILGAVFISAFIAEMHGFPVPTAAVASLVFIISSLLPDIEMVVSLEEDGDVVIYQQAVYRVAPAGTFSVEFPEASELVAQTAKA